MTTDRALAWEGCINVRDLGGLATDGDATTSWRALVRADTLCGLTDSGIEALREYGVRTIVDLRSEAENAEAPHPLAGADGMTYRHVPLNDPASAERMAKMEAADDRYAEMVAANGERLVGVLRAIAEAPPGGVVFHCFAGRDRTGIVAAVLLRLAGVSDDDIVLDYETSDERLKPRYEKWLLDLEPAMRTRFEAAVRDAGRPLRAALAYIDDVHGGTTGYLKAHGADDALIATLRGRMRAERS